jgi:alpha-beta hydrolase superfamily lysophospholipase
MLTMTVAEQQTFTGADGLELESSCWRPRGEPRAVVALIHGLGEHAGRYTTLVTHLTAAGFVVCGFDHRGHGRSPGRRGHIGSWSEYREDVRAFLGRTGKQFPDRPMFLYGHSLGALIAAEYVIAYPGCGLAGLILSGIPLKPGGISKPHLVLAARTLSRVWPTLSVSLGVDGSQLSRDKDVVREYDEDPLVHHVGTMRWGAETLSAIDRVRSGAANIRLPVLILHGGEDKVNSVEGSRELFEKVSSADKLLIVYPGGAHEPHNDIQRDTVMLDVEEWLNRRMTEPPKLSVR